MPRTSSLKSYSWHPCTLFTTRLRWKDSTRYTSPPSTGQPPVSLSPPDASPGRAEVGRPPPPSPTSCASARRYVVLCVTEYIEESAPKRYAWTIAQALWPRSANGMVAECPPRRRRSARVRVTRQPCSVLAIGPDTKRAASGGLAAMQTAGKPSPLHWFTTHAAADSPFAIRTEQITFARARIAARWWQGRGSANHSASRSAANATPGRA